MIFARLPLSSLCFLSSWPIPPLLPLSLVNMLIVLELVPLVGSRKLALESDARSGTLLPGVDVPDKEIVDMVMSRFIRLGPKSTQFGLRILPVLSGEDDGSLEWEEVGVPDSPGVESALFERVGFELAGATPRSLISRR